MMVNWLSKQQNWFSRKRDIETVRDLEREAADLSNSSNDGGNQKVRERYITGNYSGLAFKR